MLKIIKGRKYDTVTATKICSYDNGLPESDFDALCEQLYIQRTGEFFLYGYGGARTAYAEAAYNECVHMKEAIADACSKL